MSWIHLNDMVRVIEFLMSESQLSGAFNVTAPEPVSNLEFTRTLARVMNRPAIFPVPAFVLKLALGEMSDLLLTGQNVVPVRLQEAGFTFEFSQLEPALKQALNQ